MVLERTFIVRITIASIIVSALAACGGNRGKVELRYTDRAEANAREAEAAEEEVARMRQAERRAQAGKPIAAGYGVDVKSVVKVDEARIEKVIAAAEKVVSETERVTAGKVFKGQKLAKAKPDNDWGVKAEAERKPAAETKPAAKAESKPAVKSEPKAEVKPVAKAEAKPVMKADVKPVAKAEESKPSAAAAKQPTTSTLAAANKPAPSQSTTTQSTTTQAQASVAKSAPPAESRAVASTKAHEPASVAAKGGVYVVQLGAFREKGNAERFYERMKAEGVPAILKSMNHSKNGEIYVVRLEPTANREEAEKNLKRLHDEKNLSTQMIVLPADAQ